MTLPVGRAGTAAADTAGGAAAAASAADGGGEEGSNGDGGGGDALDFSKMISSEVKDLKDVKKQPFVVHDTGIKTCMFIGMPLVGADMPGPCEVRSAPLPPCPRGPAAHALLEHRSYGRMPMVQVLHSAMPLLTFDVS